MTKWRRKMNFKSKQGKGRWSKESEIERDWDDMVNWDFVWVIFSISVFFQAAKVTC